MTIFFRKLGRQLRAYFGAVFVTVAGLVLIDNVTAPWYYGLEPYGFGYVPASEVIGKIIALAIVGSAITLPSFALTRGLASKWAAARARRVGPVAATLSGVLAILPVVLLMDAAIYQVLFAPDLYNLSFAVGGGASGGLLYWTLGGFRTSMSKHSSESQLGPTAPHEVQRQ